VNALASAWAERGTHRELVGHSIFTVDVPARGEERHPPLLVIHGFPTSSFDFRTVVDRLADDRRVLLFDLLGYGLSDKPDQAYTIAEQADVATAVVEAAGVDRLGLLTHDLGDTVGGELLARNLGGDWDVEVTDRTLSNGSIYIEMAQLSPGQLLLLSLPDERLDPDAGIDEAGVTAGIAATFASGSDVDPQELAALGALVAHGDGHLLLARTIRYIEERRRNQDRFTGPIETHPSPLTVVWGTEDPIAVVAMTDRLVSARPDADLHLLAGIGHYPMVEAPGAFLDAYRAGRR
jgi:pimeloyl-ACP methyl ester carboxylesterase